jgi:hypothetical protein
MAAGLSVYPRVAGTASGSIGFSQMAVSALGTLIVGVLPHEGPFAMAGVVLATQIVACALGLIAVRLPVAPAPAPAVCSQPIEAAGGDA